jgi:hypothetical protein
MGLDADFRDSGERAARERELTRKVDPIDELMRIVGVQAKSRRHAPQGADVFKPSPAHQGLR